MDADLCIYMRWVNNQVAIIGLYVDNCLILTHHSLLQQTKDILSSRFPIKDLKEPTSILGIEILHNQERGMLELRQGGHITSVLAKANMSDCKPVLTPMTAGLQLTKIAETPAHCKELPYHQIVGSLLYIACATRWDIAYAVGHLCRFMNAHDETHWKAVKRVLRYLQGTKEKTIQYRRDVSARLTIAGYSDSNWGEDWIDRKSIAGYLFLLAGGPIAWASKKQSSVATSSCEAELLALSKATHQALYLRRFLSPLRLPEEQPTLILCDNQSAIAISERDQRQAFSSRLKHLNIRHLHIVDSIGAGAVVMDFCPTEEMLADSLTKALAQDRLLKLEKTLSAYNRPSSSTGRVLEESDDEERDERPCRQ